ncbi:MAG TPA: TlpA disulfide reductase family protein [Gammaproteobacteria bacterium]|nr:TlpA disulfide reductase family protein [Gammaproteobacteria bacterium]
MQHLIRVLSIVAMVLLAAGVQAQNLDFSLPDLNGVHHKLSDYRGKWVVVNYWATWCPPCREEIPELEKFYKAHVHKNAVVLGVNFQDATVEQLRAFARSHHMTYPILRREPAASTALGPVPGLPTTYLISPSGKRVGRQVGPLTAKALDDFINSNGGDDEQPPSMAAADQGR